MKVRVGVLFEAFQLAEHESYQIAETKAEGETTKDFRQIRALHAVLHKALQSCSLEVELYPELDHLLAPFFERYNLEIISK